MKKLLTIICLISLLVMLTSCDPSMFQYDYDELKETVLRVEYIYYDNPHAVQLNEFLVEKKDKLLPFDFDKMEVRATLSEDKLEMFLKSLSEAGFLMHWVHSDSPKGDCIRMIYNNGDFEILSCDTMYSGSFYSNGQVKRFIGDGLSKEFLSKWFDEQN